MTLVRSGAGARANGACAPAARAAGGRCDGGDELERYGGHVRGCVIRRFPRWHRFGKTEDRRKSRALAEPAPSASSGQALSEKQKQILRCAQNDSEGLGMTPSCAVYGNTEIALTGCEKRQNTAPLLSRLGLIYRNYEKGPALWKGGTRSSLDDTRQCAFHLTVFSHL